ncbi:unnamed protein product [Thlaspi arvense]|uniref:Rab-GAP TBC domain-containing protein n=1 Tax=Thlaspi arvense TaxID=13288 RepID=A0AAU9SY08_THLAR|nr:unnamed protein product [Thlaspi arvense]
MVLSEIEPSVSESLADESDRRFANLRGVRWRVNLGVLPFQPSSIDDLRKATAESRRRYAALRRRLLIDPHLSKDLRNSPDLSIDNPLSQNPDSTWGRFFRNAELEKTLDQDLSRLYPEHWSYFQAPGCQGMLRRILLLWCLKHPEYGYRQGMHELLAPLLYVLHVDVERLSEVRKSYEDHFTDRFDGLSFEERDITYNFEFKKFLEDFTDDEIGDIHGNSKKIKSLDELDPEIQSIVLLSDAYGAEGELGIVLSDKFMEHDAYCMFDALMSGAHGCVSMAGFFAYTPANGSHTGLPPVLEACTAFYHLLSFVDSSLHSHLVELGVEPQYFGLRWLRVLFGREFLLQDLLIVWDEIFSADNTPRTDEDNITSQSFKIFDSPRGALISGMAVSMILSLRSSLLATENAASCLQRLLNFPEKIDVRKIIEKAKSLQALALDADVRSSALAVFDQSISPAVPTRTSSFPSGSTSPKSPLIITPQSYWEEKWRVLQKAAEEEKQNPSVPKKKAWFKVKRLFRAESEPTHSAKAESKAKVSSVARNLLEDFNRQVVSEPEEANTVDVVNNEDSSVQETEEANIVDVVNNGDSSVQETEEANIVDVVNNGDSSVQETEERNTDFETAGEESVGAVEENSSDVFSDPNSPLRDSNSIENDSDSSTGSILFANEKVKDEETSVVDSPLPISSQPSIEFPVAQSNDEEDTADKSVAVIKERGKALPGKFQWFWKFGRNLTSEETRSNGVESSKSDLVCSSETHSPPQASSSSSKGDTDQNVMSTLKNLGNSMLEHIQVIESVFQQERVQVQAGLMENISKTNFVEKGQVTAVTALKELRKISNLLLEM